MPRVAAIAIDAAERWYMEQLADAGVLPNIQRIRERSARFALRTRPEFRSELVWARFLSGREPLEEGNWSEMMVFDPADYGLGTNHATTTDPFFALGPGTKVVALDLIHSQTAEGVDGMQVVAWGSHSPQWPRTSRPPGTLTEAIAQFGENPAFGNDFDYGWYFPDFVDALADACATGAQRRADIGHWLLDQQPDWDLLLLCMSEVHGMGHQFWHGVDPAHPLHGRVPTSDQSGARTADVWRATDRAVGSIVDALPPDTTLLLFALHGFQPADDLASTVLTPELFHRLRFNRSLLRQPDTGRWRADGCPPVVPPVGRHWGEYMTDLFADSPKQQLRRALASALPPPVFEGLRRAAGRAPAAPLATLGRTPGPEHLGEVTAEDLERFHRPANYQNAAWYRRHWPAMPWFVLPSFADGHLRINLAGRERDGIVPAEDYETACKEVIEILHQCRDARTGEPIVEDVLWTRKDDPAGGLFPDADLLVVWRGAPDAIEHPDTGVIGPFAHMRTAHHSPNGWAYIAGPGIAAGDRGERPTDDLTSTVLRLLERDNPRCTLGQPLLERAGA